MAVEIAALIPFYATALDVLAPHPVVCVDREEPLLIRQMRRIWCRRRGNVLVWSSHCATE